MRLKGRNRSLKRSSALPGEMAGAPGNIRFLETLQVFGIRADFMANFRAILEDEGLAVDRRVVVVPVEIDLPETPLKVIRVARSVAGDDPATAFRRTGPALVLRPPRGVETGANGNGARGEGEGKAERGTDGSAHKPIRDEIDRYVRRRLPVIDWYPKIQALKANDDNGGLEVDPTKHHPFGPEHLRHIDFDRLFFDLQRHKHERGWHNLTIARSLLPAILAGVAVEGRGAAERKRSRPKAPCWYQLRIPRREMRFTNDATIRRWQEIALTVLIKYATRYYKGARLAWEARHLEYRNLTARDPIFPKPAASGGAEYGQSLEIVGSGNVDEDEALRREIEKWLKMLSRRAPEGGAQERVHNGPAGLVGLKFDRHLYTPLLRATSQSVVVTPTDLNDGEFRFVEDLRKFCNERRESLEGTALHLVRNPSRGHGVHFFEANNFHPDFILWAVGGGVQRIAFIDPKGLVREGPESPKVMLHERIKKLQGRLRLEAIERGLGDPRICLNSFIVSVTPRAKLMELWNEPDPSAFAKRNIVFQEDGADRCIGRILAGMGVPGFRAQQETQAGLGMEKESGPGPRAND